MSERPKTLFEKTLETEPGRHAHVISELLYGWGGDIKKMSCRPDLGPDYHQLLCRARDFLEKQAIELVKQEVPPWVEELRRKEERIRAADGEGSGE